MFFPTTKTSDYLTGDLKTPHSSVDEKECTWFVSSVSWSSVPSVRPLSSRIRPIPSTSNRVGGLSVLEVKTSILLRIVSMSKEVRGSLFFEHKGRTE